MLEDYKLRVIEERIELEIKLRALKSFMNSEQFNNIDPESKKLMQLQRVAMQDYSSTLYERIRQF